MSGTALGVPVVPEVKRMTATSEGSTSGSGAALAGFGRQRGIERDRVGVLPKARRARSGGEDGAASGLGQHPRGVVIGKQRVDQHRHPAGGDDRPIGDDPGRAVGRDDRHRVAAPDAALGERLGERQRRADERGE